MSPVTSSAPTVLAAPPATEGPAARLRNRLVVVLAVTSGATDAIGFLALGSAFTSVMTGNMVLFGIAGAQQDWQTLELTAIAIGSFIAGAALGARVAGTPQRDDATWPLAISRALCLQLGLFVVFAGCWWALGSHPHGLEMLPLLSLNAIALGLQSSAIQRFGVSGLSTTYMTGTLTSTVIRLVSGRGLRTVSHSLSILSGLIVGAVVGAALVRFAPPLVPVVQLLTVGVVLLVARARRPLLSR